MIILERSTGEHRSCPRRMREKSIVYSLFIKEYRVLKASIIISIALNLLVACVISCHPVLHKK